MRLSSPDPSANYRLYTVTPS